MGRRTLRVGGTLLVIWALARPALAGPPREEATPAPPAAVERAKALYRDGVARLAAEDAQGALAAFERSVALLPSYRSMAGSAYCLERLGRLDEAHALYEEALERFGAEMPAAKRDSVKLSMGQLRAQVGRLSITSPRGGALWIDGKERGALPLKRPASVLPGARRIEVRFAGGVPYSRTLEVPAGGLVVLEVPGEAEVPRSDLWRGVFVELFSGYAGGPSMNSDAERSSQTTCDELCPRVDGGFVGGRIGKRLASGLALELSGGFLALRSSTFHRTLRRTQPAPVTDTQPAPATDTQCEKMPEECESRFEFDTEILQLGGMYGVGLSYRLPLFASLSLVPRLTVSGLSTQIVHTIENGTVVTGGKSEKVYPFFGRAAAEEDPNAAAEDRKAPISTSLYVLSELGVEATWGAVHVGVSLGFGVVLDPGTRLEKRALAIRVNDPGGIFLPSDCVQGKVGCEERAQGTFSLWMPALHIGYDF
jgi:hypothetical protein